MASPMQRQQPQQGVQLDRSNRFAANALAVVSAAQDINYATGKLLSRSGSGYAKRYSVAGQAWAFRKNFYVETEVLPAIGTASYVEFWMGYPTADLYASGSSGQDPGFLTGSNTNQIGIFGSQGSRTGGTTSPTQWGVVNDWDAGVLGMDNSGEVLTPGELTLLIAVRRQTGMELWRNGRMVRFLPHASPTSKPASSLICGAFIRDAGYWSSSSDTILAGRVLTPIEPTATELISFSANVWQMWQAPRRRSLVMALGATPNSYTLPAVKGTYSLTGNAASLRVSRNLPATAGSYSIAGNAAALRVARRIIAAPGAYSVTGNAANLIKGTAPKSLQVESGSYSIIGRAVTLKASRRMTASSGSYAITGYATGFPQDYSNFKATVQYRYMPRSKLELKRFA